MNPQVLIVGAGPVGLVMAAELARYRTLFGSLIRPRRDPISQRLVLWTRTLELLDRASCTEPFIAAANTVHAANIMAANKLLAHVSFAEVKSPYP
jgi:2-polyprenyl-6-methoxyphenol hydroxylase-like FAD-dependent oxidoreductase